MKHLLAAVKQCPGHRFYSSSILMVYDGVEADRLSPHTCIKENHTGLIEKIGTKRVKEDDYEEISIQSSP